MSERAFWHSNPEALLVSAAQALEAKTDLARHLGRRWEEVDANLAESLLEVLRALPDARRLRRREDRAILGWVHRLIAEVPDDDPWKVQIQRRLQQLYG
jgi:hypothetical protein